MTTLTDGQVGDVSSGKMRRILSQNKGFSDEEYFLKLVYGIQFMTNFMNYIKPQGK